MKETLEEAAEKYAEIYRCPATNDNEYCKHDVISAINFGAKWQQDKKLYSEEDIKHAFFSGCHSERKIKPRIKCWEEFIEQFKKK